MSPINSRIKGSDFENEVAKILTGWWGSKLKRTPMSGGWSQSAASGDITPVGDDRDLFPMSVECKKTESWSFADLLKLPKGDDGHLIAYWNQCIRDCENYNKSNESRRKRAPLLVFSANRQPIYVMLKAEDFYGMEKVVDINPILMWEYGDSTMFIMKLDLFLQMVPAKQFKKKG